MNGHRSDAKKGDKLDVDTHFSQPGHNFDRDARFTIIEKIKKSNLQPEELTNLLLRREDFWMERLQTIQPNGFNKGLNFPWLMLEDCQPVHTPLRNMWQSADRFDVKYLTSDAVAKQEKNFFLSKYIALSREHG